MKQFYKLVFAQQGQCIDTEKIVVESFKQLQEYVKSELRHITNDLEYNINKKFMKRIYISDSFVDLPNGKQKKAGKVFTIETLAKSKEHDIIECWTRRIHKDQLYQYCGFKEIDA